MERATQATGDETRWATARRLLHDNTLDRLMRRSQGWALRFEAAQRTRASRRAVSDSRRPGAESGGGPGQRT